jgi:chromosome segregation ATPase
MGSNTNEPAPEALLAKARERLRVTFEKISQLEHQSFNDQREHWDSIREKYRIKVDDLQKSLPDIDDTLPGANGEQVAEKMIAAHVELAGLEARRDAILEQIQKRKQEGTKIENNYNKSAEEYTRLNENLQKETNGDKQAAIQKELDRVQSEFSRLQQEMTTKASQYGPEQTAELNKMLVQTEIDLAGTKARLEMLQKMNNILHQEHKALRKHEEIFRELENARTKLKEASDRLERMNLDAAHKPLEIIVLDDAPAAKPPEKKDGKISPSPSPFSPIPTMPAAKPPEKKDEKK